MDHVRFSVKKMIITREVEVQFDMSEHLCLVVMCELTFNIFFSS